MATQSQIDQIYSQWLPQERCDVWRLCNALARQTTAIPYLPTSMVGIECVTCEDVSEAVKKLKSSSTIGVDNVPLFIVKGCAEHLIYPFLILFKLSLKPCTFPETWKRAKAVLFLGFFRRRKNTP